MGMSHATALLCGKKNEALLRQVHFVCDKKQLFINEK